LNILETKFEGLHVAETNFLSDSRGSFGRLFCKNELASALKGKEILQINVSLTEPCGAIRGMHFQHPPHGEMKLVRCIKGSVWDVVVDIRKDSNTFMQWHAEELSQENARMMIIPEGFAHGFQTMETTSELLYLHTEYYMPDSEDGLAYNDPKLDISWPLPITDVSERDQNHPFLSKEFSGIII
jgi:dTDP-4-dehydrorhamnose 3,5-epimerase